MGFVQFLSILRARWLVMLLIVLALYKELTLLTFDPIQAEVIGLPVGLLRELLPGSLPYDPFYWEDVDLGLRAWQRGYESLYCPASRALHLHRVTVNRYFAPDEVRRMLRQLMPMLERYRFVREVPRERDDEVADERVLYEALPGLYHYDPRRLAPEVVARALGGDGEEEAP